MTAMLFPPPLSPFLPSVIAGCQEAPYFFKCVPNLAAKRSHLGELVKSAPGGASKMAPEVKVLARKPGNLSWTPGTCTAKGKTWKERVNSWKFPLTST